MTCHYSKSCIRCIEKHNCKIYHGIKAGYNAISTWQMQTDKIESLEKRLRKLVSWRDAHIKKLDTIIDEESEGYLYSEERLEEIEEEIAELETKLALIFAENNRFF